MVRLLSKVQYKRFEQGEFDEAALRTVDETIELVRTYPWVEQRTLADVQLTCPSITIEQENGSFIKIGPYFSGKFCIYLLDGTEKLFEKVIPNLEDSFDVIKAFFDGEDLQASFKRNSMVWLPLKHFVTRSFEYRSTPERFLWVFFYPLAFSTGFNLVFLPLSFKLFMDRQQWEFLWLVVPMTLLGLSAVCLILYLSINYYTYCKYLYLKISKGKDAFLFGTTDHFKEYSKRDIKKIDAYGSSNRRSIVREYAYVVLTMQDGEVLKIPSLLIGDIQLIGKIADWKPDNYTFHARAINWL